MTYYKKATQMKLRFETNKGYLSVEDLWDLPLNNSTPNLDKLAIDISRQIKENSVESFVNKSTTNSVVEVLTIKLEILKDVINTKIEAQKAREGEIKKQEQKSLILNLIREKEQEGLKGLSIAELQAKL